MRLIDGPCDPNSGRHMAERYAELIPDADVVLLDDEIGHWPQIEDPQGVLTHFLEFVEGPKSYLARAPADEIRHCRADDRAAILALVNAAAEAYRGVIPDDCWHEPYMTADELDREIEAGVEFWGYEADGELVG